MATSGSGSLGAFSFGVVPLLFCAAIVVFEIVAWWKVFEKAEQPGWAALIPFYNGYIMLKMAGKPGWWLLLYLIPLVNFVVAILVMLNFAKAFGKGTGFAMGLVFLGGIFIPILAFGDAKYQGVPA